jgi:hypothetical protein
VAHQDGVTGSRAKPRERVARGKAVPTHATLRPVRSLTPLEAAVAVAVAGSVLAVTVPVFLDNLHASRLNEPLEGLQRIATRATALAAGRPAEAAYPESVPLTPAEVPRGERATDPAGSWEHPTWRALDFSWSVPHCFSFAFESKNQKSASTFRARAHGDLDGDGILSTFVIGGESRDGAEPVVFAIDVDREVE